MQFDRRYFLTSMSAFALKSAHGAPLQAQVMLPQERPTLLTDPTIVLPKSCDTALKILNGRNNYIDRLPEPSVAARQVDESLRKLTETKNKIDAYLRDINTANNTQKARLAAEIVDGTVIALGVLFLLFPLAGAIAIGATAATTAVTLTVPVIAGMATWATEYLATKYYLQIFSKHKPDGCNSVPDVSNLENLVFTGVSAGNQAIHFAIKPSEVVAKKAMGIAVLPLDAVRFYQSVREYDQFSNSYECLDTGIRNSVSKLNDRLLQVERELRALQRDKAYSEFFTQSARSTTEVMKFFHALRGMHDGRGCFVNTQPIIKR